MPPRSLPNICDVEEGIRLYERMSQEDVSYGITVATTLHVTSAIAVGLLLEQLKGTNPGLVEDLEEADSKDVWALLLLLASGAFVADSSDREDIEELLEVGESVLRANLEIGQDGE
jgi:hypothetical protein